MPHTQTRPARHTNYSTELMVNVRGIHGHQGYCSCGWEGDVWARVSKAQAEAKWHFFHEHSTVSATRGTEAS